MTTPQAKFSTGAATKIQTATERVLRAAIDKRGSRTPRAAGTGSSSATVAIAIGLFIGKGVYNGNYSTGTVTAFNSTNGSLTGQTLGAAVIVIHGPDYLGSSSSTYGLLSPPCGPVPGVKIGVDSNTGKDIVVVGGASGGC